MKRVVLNYLVIAILVVSVAFVSCNKGDEKFTVENNTFTVAFYSKNENIFASKTVAEGEKVRPPDGNYDGWFKDNITFNDLWNFLTDTVTADLSLYAKWIINDYTGNFELGTFQKILDGYHVNAIEFDSKGNA